MIDNNRREVKSNNQSSNQAIKQSTKIKHQYNW